MHLLYVAVSFTAANYRISLLFVAMHICSVLVHMIIVCVFDDLHSQRQCTQRKYTRLQIYVYLCAAGKDTRWEHISNYEWTGHGDVKEFGWFTQPLLAANSWQTFIWKLSGNLDARRWRFLFQINLRIIRFRYNLIPKWPFLKCLSEGWGCKR